MCVALVGAVGSGRATGRAELPGQAGEQVGIGLGRKVVRAAGLPGCTQCQGSVRGGANQLVAAGARRAEDMIALDVSLL